MNKLFPRMYDCPEGKQIAQGGIYWAIYALVLPTIMFIATGGVISSRVVNGFDCAYYLINFLAVILIFRTYLIDSFWNVKMHIKHFLITVGIGLIAFFAIEIALFFLWVFPSGTLGGFPLPIADSLYGLVTRWAFEKPPILNHMCLIVCVPVAMSCLYYAVCFAPTCQNKIWIGYLLVAVIALIPTVLLVTAQGYAVLEAVTSYICLLPFHMCACWIYQNTDTIWGPILFHAIVNLISIY